MFKKIFYPFIFVLAAVYKEILHIRFYLNLIKNKGMHSGITTISVGNLQMGGSGKTPLCVELLSSLIKRKIQFIHSSRAYKSKAEKTGLLIDLSQKQVDNLEAIKVGDEPLLIMRLLKKGNFVLGGMRTKLLKQLSTEYFSKPYFDLLILEDAFQHVKIYRDLDVLLIDTTCSIENFQLLPLGYLREPSENMWRADTIILSKWNLVSDEQKNNWLSYLENHRQKKASILKMDYLCQGLCSLDQSDLIHTKNIKNEKIVLFSGVANPKSVESLLKEFGAEIIKSFIFADHATITGSKLQMILDYATQNQAKVVCTEKDAVKLDENSNSKTIYYVKLKTEVLTLDGRPWDFLENLNILAPTQFS